MSRLVAVLAAAGLLLLAAPAAAENPVLDAEGDADVAASLADAAALHEICYGYELSVQDLDTGQWGGTYASSSAGAGVSALAAPECAQGSVVLLAAITYTSSFSEAEDSASWRLVSSVPSVTIDDVERRLGVQAGDLLDDARSELVLLNAVQVLPSLVTEEAGKAPVVLEPNTAALPSDARPTNTPGSDWLRENGVLLGGCLLLVLAGAVMLLLSRRPTYRPL